MVLDKIKNEILKRNIKWITDDECKKCAYSIHEKYKYVEDDFEKLLLHISIEEFVDMVLIEFCLNGDSRIGKNILKFFAKIQKNSILKKINPWFKYKFLFLNIVNNFFQDDFIKTYKNIWSGFVISQVKSEKKKNYNINKSGFRGYELQPKASYISCFGCEKTFGVGLSENQTWPHILSLATNKFVYNYGDIDASIDTITRYIWQHLQEKTPDAIFVLFPDIKRMEYFDDDFDTMNVINLLPETDNISKQMHDSYKKLTNVHNCLLKFLKNFLFIKTLCFNKNIPFYWYTTSKDLLNVNFKEFTMNDNDIDINKTHANQRKLINIFTDEVLDLSFDDNKKIADMFYKLYKYGKI